MGNLPEELKARLGSTSIQERLAALQDCLKYSEGLDLFNQHILTEKSEKVLQGAYWILHGYKLDSCTETDVPVATDTIACIAISPDEKYVIGGSWKLIRIWDAETGELLRKFEAHFQWVLSVAISPDGKTLVTGGSDCQIKVWEFITEKCLHTLDEHSGWINALAITPDGKTLVSGSSDRTIQIWNLKTGQKQHTLTNHSSCVYSIVISSNSSFFASGSADKTVKIWDLNNGNLLQDIDNLSDWVQSISLNLMGNKLVSISRVGEINTWQSDDSKLVDENSDWVTNLARWILIITSILIAKFTGGASLSLMFLLPLLPSGSGAQTEQKFKYAVFTHTNSHFWKHSKVNNCVSVSNGKNFFAIQNSNEISLYEADTEQPLFSFSCTKFMSSMSILSNKKRLILGSLDWLQVWDIETNTSPFSFRGSSKPELSRIEILKPLKPLKIEEIHSFKIRGFDQYDREILIDRPVVWKVTGGGSINATSGHYVAGRQEGLVTVTATVGEFLETPIQIRVIDPPRLHNLVVIPDSVFKLYFGKQQSFHVQGFDQHGRKFKLSAVSWSATGGTIQNGIYTAGQQAGTFEVIVRSKNITKCIKIEILEPPKLANLKIYPISTRLEFGDTQAFHVEGFDQYGCIFQINHSKIKWDSSSGKIDRHGIFTAGFTEGTAKISATVGERQASTNVTVIEPARLTYLEITPSRITLEPGEIIQFTIRGLDQHHQEISQNFDSLKSIRWEADGGEIDGKGNFTVRENAKGSFKVTASIPNLTLQCSAQIVVPSVVKELLIVPDAVSVEPNQPVQFQAIACDQTGALMVPDPNTVIWCCSSGGHINLDGIFKGGYQKRYVTVTARVGAVDANATITLIPVLREIRIIPNQNIFLEPGGHQQFKVIGLDQYGCEINPGAITWEATGGKITQQGYYTAGFNAKGTYTVTARACEIPEYDIKMRFFVWGTYLKLLLQFMKHYKQIYAFGDKLDNLLNGFNYSEEEPSALEENHDNEAEPTSEVDGNVDFSLEEFELDLKNWILKNVAKKLLFQSLNWIANGFLKASEISDRTELTVIPVVRKLEISPKEKCLQPGEKCILTLKGYDQVGAPIPIDSKHVVWQIKGGELTLENPNWHSLGLTSNFIFTASSAEGDFLIEVRVAECKSKTTIKVEKNRVPSYTPVSVISFHENKSASDKDEFSDRSIQTSDPGKPSSDKFSEESDSDQYKSAPGSKEETANSTSEKSGKTDSKTSKNSSKSSRKNGGLRNTKDGKQSLDLTQFLIEEILDTYKLQGINRYRFVVLVARRANQIRLDESLCTTDKEAIDLAIRDILNYLRIPYI